MAPGKSPVGEEGGGEEKARREGEREGIGEENGSKRESGEGGEG